MSGKIVKLGLWVIAAGAAILVAGQVWFPDSPQTADAARYALIGGGALLALGALLYLLEKMGVVILQYRCVRCGRVIPRGHVYCADHLKKSIEEARDKLHGEKGLGI